MDGGFPGRRPAIFKLEAGFVDPNRIDRATFRPLEMHAFSTDPG